MIDHDLPCEYWEIGNENYGKWEFPYNQDNNKYNVSGDLYGEIAMVMAAAMKKVDPNIKIGAVSTNYNITTAGAYSS